MNEIKEFNLMNELRKVLMRMRKRMWVKVRVTRLKLKNFLRNNWEVLRLGFYIKIYKLF
jgi:hypothetical protein